MNWTVPSSAWSPRRSSSSTSRFGPPAGDAPAIARPGTGWPDGHLGNVPDALLAFRDEASFGRRAAERIADTTVAVVAARSSGSRWSSPTSSSRSTSRPRTAAWGGRRAHHRRRTPDQGGRPRSCVAGGRAGQRAPGGSTSAWLDRRGTDRVPSRGRQRAGAGPRAALRQDAVSTSRNLAANSSGLPVWPYSPPRNPP